MIQYILSYKYRTLFLTVFIIVGLVSSKAVMSIGVISMFVNILLDRNYKTSISNFLTNKKLFSLSFFFLASLLALTYSSDFNHGFGFVKNKLPLLVIPLAYSKMDKMTKNEFFFILSFFILIMFSTSLLVLYKYLGNYNEINLLMKKGTPIWVPFNHLRFSVMLVFAFTSSVYLFFQKVFQKKQLNLIFIFLSLFFFVLIHVLSVRTGLLIMYINILIVLSFYIYKNKNFKLLFVSLFLFFLIPFLAYKNISSLKNRINYMKYDWQQLSKNNIGSNSDSRRIVSYKLGFILIKENFPLGLGTGDIQKEMNLLYDKLYPKIKDHNRIMPHNQLLYTVIDYGLIGLLALLCTLFYPFINIKRKKENIFYLSFLILSITPLLYDISLEMQLGICFFALFSSLILKQISLTENHV